MSHTKGPWKAWAAEDGRFEIYGSGEPDYLVLCSRNPNENRVAEMLANARLIAAAPELLDALRHMHWCGHCSEGSWEDCEGGRAALDAIAKVEGR